MVKSSVRNQIMADNPLTSPTNIFDPALQTEKIAFDSEQLVICDGCGRANPPNRFNCIYCARELANIAETDTNAKLVLRKLELWEKGFNVIFRSHRNADLKKAAELLSADAEFIQTTIDAGTPLPLARVESEKEALYLISALAQCGLDCGLVADEDLRVSHLPTRIRRIDLDGQRIGLTNFNTSSVTTADLSQLAVAVLGRLISGRRDMTEKRGRKGKVKLLDETETSSDELVLDLYLGGEPDGYRINQAGFDFSCLGEEKGLLAAENMLRLMRKLRNVAPELTVSDDYTDIRGMLDRVWEQESRKDPQGLKRTGHKVEFGSVASSNNLDQFTRYSRLQRYLYETSTS